MALPENRSALSDTTYRLITDLIYSSSGLRFDQSSRFIIHRRLIPRLDELQLDSFEKYYQYLRYHPNRESEMDIVFDLIATHETYFFREQFQLDAFTSEIIPQLVEYRKQTRCLRIWCAGCSSGEEPYTVSILCKQHPLLQNWSIDIFASDISQKMIQAARRGVYAETAFRSTTEEVKQAYFDKTNDDLYRIRDDIRRTVTFMKFNLLNEDRIGLLGEMDAIFCRNVIIYFDLEARKRIIGLFYQKLRSEGFLLLGHAETLAALSTPFHLRHLKSDMVYQK